MGQFDFTTGQTASGVIDKSLFDADTFLYATTDNTPVATSPANVLAALTGHAAAAFDWNSQDLTGIAALTMTGDLSLAGGKAALGGNTDWGTGATGTQITGAGYDWVTQTVGRVNTNLNGTAAAAAYHAMSITANQTSSNSIFGTWTELYVSNSVDLTGADNFAAIWGQFEAGTGVTLSDTGCFTAGLYANVKAGSTLTVPSGHSLNGVRAQIEVSAITNNGTTAAFECLKSGGVDWEFGLYLADVATDIRFHSGTTLIDDGTDLTLAGANLVLGAGLTTADVTSLCGAKAVFNSWGAVFGDAYYLYMRSDYSAYVASIDSNYLDISGNTGLRMRVSDVGVIFSITASSCAMYPPTTFTQGVIILPEAEFKLRLPVTDTVGTIEGEVWYDASENTIKVVTGSIDSVALLAATQTLTNKTLITGESDYIQLGDTSGQLQMIPWNPSATIGGVLLQPSAGNRQSFLALQPQGTEDEVQFSLYNADVGITGSNYSAFNINLDGDTVTFLYEDVGSPPTSIAHLYFRVNMETEHVRPVTDRIRNLGSSSLRYGVVHALEHQLTQAFAGDHRLSGLTAPMTAGTALTRTQAVYVGGDSKMEKALATGTATMPAIALCAMPTLAEDVEGTFLLQGFYRDDTWNWTIGGLLYIDRTTAGALTQTAPSTTGDQVQVVGVAISADIIYFNPSLELVEIS